MVCGQKLNTALDRKPKHPGVKFINRESDATEDEDPIFKIEVSTVQTQGKQLLTKVQFLNQSEQFVTEIECQLDMGATCNVICYRDLASICQTGEPPIEKSKDKLRLFHRSTIKLHGVASLKVNRVNGTGELQF